MSALRVLLVDDEEELVFTLEERLQLRGMCAEAFTSGAEALKRIAQQEFEVIVVDVKMPGMDGLELLRQIKTLRPAAQVILLTGRASENESRLGLEQGAFAYLIKPINIDELIKKMEQAVSRRTKE